MNQKTFVPQSYNKNLLDSLAIIVSLASLNCYPEYVKARNALFGTHFLSRLWMKYIYPRFSPRKFKALCDAWNIERFKMQQEFMIAVLDKASASKHANWPIKNQWINLAKRLFPESEVMRDAWQGYAENLGLRQLTSEQKRQAMLKHTLRNIGFSLKIQKLEIDKAVLKEALEIYKSGGDNAVINWYDSLPSDKIIQLDAEVDIVLELCRFIQE